MRLHDELRGWMPDGLGPSQRLVALLVAADANDDTRRGWPGQDALLTWSGLSEQSLRRVLGDLERAGVVVRVVLGLNKAGRPVFACRGKRTELRVLRLSEHLMALAGEPLPVDNSGGLSTGEEGKALAGERQLSTKALARERHPGKKGAHVRAERRLPASERRSRASGKALTSEPPLVSISSDSSTSRHPRATPEHTAAAAAVDAVREKTGRTITDRHAAAVVAQLIGDRTDIRNPTAYVRSAIARDPDPARFLPTPAPPRFRAIPGGPA